MPASSAGAFPGPPASPSRLTRRSMIGYSFGAARSACFGTVPGLLLVIYLTNTLGMFVCSASVRRLARYVSDSTGARQALFQQFRTA